MKLFYFILISLFFVSCSIKESVMFNNDNPTPIEDDPIELQVTVESRILPNDVLSIDIYNMNQKSNILKGSNILNDNTNSSSQNRYIVENDGTIHLPLVKKVYVQGLTAQELSNKLTKMYAKFLREPYVKVQIKNHRVYVFGEVAKQGYVPIEGNSISLIEVLSKSGGLTNDAVLNKIRIISKSNGKYIMKTVNLRNFNTLNLVNLTLENNSIVYVEPRASKAYKLAIDNYLPMISAISSVSGTLVNINTLKKDGFIFGDDDSSNSTPLPIQETQTQTYDNYELR